MPVEDDIHHEQPMTTEIHKLGSRVWREVHGKGTKVILVTSALRGEGKSTTVAHLASALSMHPGRRILAIDSDFRNPSLNRHFNVKFERGLAAVLRGECSVTDAIVHGTLHGDRTGLDLLLPEEDDGDPRLLLNTPRLVESFRMARAAYDLVLVDAPAIIPVADATSVVPLSDAVILTVMAGLSTKHHLKRARELCLGLGGTILGIVVGNIQHAAPEYMDANYYSYADQRSKRHHPDGRNGSRRI